MTDFTSITASFKAPPIQVIPDERLVKAGIKLLIQREDLIHPQLSGNKWRKLKYNLKKATLEQRSTLVTFGGAFSNHIAAVAEAGNLFRFKTIGIIRGEGDPSNPTLQKASALGMELIYASRSDYRDKEHLIESLPIDPKTLYVLPEGGTNELAVQGCTEIITNSTTEEIIDYWCVACGTGGTAAGMIMSLSGTEQLIGFSVLKGGFMERSIQLWLEGEMAIGESAHKKWYVHDSYHFGGYAKFDSSLISFINQFKEKHGIPLDPVYTGKLLYGLFDLITRGYFPRGTTIMAIHTGGLQGIAGFNQRFGNLLH